MTKKNLLRSGKYTFQERSGEPSFYNILMTLTIHNVSRADFGTYMCRAKNSQGESDGEINLYGEDWGTFWYFKSLSHRVSHVLVEGSHTYTHGKTISEIPKPSTTTVFSYDLESFTKTGTQCIS